MVPPLVHAALVTLFTWLVQLAFVAIGIDLGNEVAEGLATVIVGYILSLFGLGLFNRIVYKRSVIATEEYHPPFT